MNPNKKRLRRTMMFLNAQKPGLIKDPYIYKPDSIMLDLEDAVAEKEKDSARFSLFHALKEINYRGIECIVRINGLDSDLWEEDIRCAVAGGADGIRIPKTETAEDVKKVENAGCEYLHIDVMDGHFVPNITLGPNVVKSLRKDVDMVFDAHLMIENPDQYIKEFVDAGCDIIVVHQEACRHLHRTIQNIKSYGIKAGVSLNPATPIETIKHIIRDVDMVLIMTVNPGFGGQSFIESMIPKIEELKMLIDSEGLNVDIQVDGGIKPYNVDKVVRAGANVIVAGSAIFNSDDIKSTVDLFRKNAFAVK